jgi:hypothetical protein
MALGPWRALPDARSALNVGPHRSHPVPLQANFLDIEPARHSRKTTHDRGPARQFDSIAVRIEGGGRIRLHCPQAFCLQAAAVERQPASGQSDDYRGTERQFNPIPVRIQIIDMRATSPSVTGAKPSRIPLKEANRPLTSSNEGGRRKPLLWNIEASSLLSLGDCGQFCPLS